MILGKETFKTLWENEKPVLSSLFHAVLYPLKKENIFNFLFEDVSNVYNSKILLSGQFLTQAK